MKVYLFVFGNGFGDRESVKEILHSMEGDIVAWRTDMSNAFYLKSELSADDLANRLREKKPLGRFLVQEFTDNKQGWITKESWRFLRDMRMRS